MIRVAIVGTGEHSRIHHGIPLSSFKERAEICGVCGKDPESLRRYADGFGIERRFDDIDKMLAETKPDALVVVTPVDVNYPLAKKLIPLGIPLLMEKPPGTSSAQAADLLSLASSCSAKVMVSFNRRFAPPMLQLSKWLRTEAASPGPRVLRAKMLRSGRAEPEFIMATAIHSLDAIIAFMGEPVEVLARRLPGAAANARLANMSFADGSLCEFALHPESGADHEVYEMAGFGYCAEADFIKGRFSALTRRVEVAAFKTPEGASESETSGALGETAHFLDCLEKGLPFGPDLKHGLAVMKLAEALQAAN